MQLRRPLGFTITEVLISVGLLAGLVAVIGTTVGTLKTAQSGVEDRNDFLQFTTLLNETMKVNTKCEDALAGVSFPLPTAIKEGNIVPVSLPNFWNPTQPNQMPKLGTLPGNISIIVGDPIKNPSNPRLRLQSLTLRAKAGVPQSVAIQDPVSGVTTTYSTYLTELSVNAEELGANGQYVSLAPATLDIPVYATPDPLDPTRARVRKCMLQITGDQVCQTVGSVLDTTTNTCVPKTQCQIEGVWQDAVCDNGYPNVCPGKIPNNATGAYSCPAGSVQSPTGTFTGAPFQYSCGKKCTAWTTPHFTLYLCMHCKK